MSIITTYADYTQLDIKQQFELVKSMELGQISIRSSKVEDEKLLKQAIKETGLKVVNFDSELKPYDLYDEQQHLEALSFFAEKAAIAKEIKAQNIYFEIPRVKDIINEYMFVVEKLNDYLAITRKNKLNLVIKPSLGNKTNTYVYLLKQFKTKDISMMYDTKHLYLNNESLITSYRILKPYIKVLKIADLNKENVPVLIGYGNLKLAEVFKSFIRDKYQGIVELDTNLFELIEEKKVGFFKKFSKKYKNELKNKESLEKKLGTLDLEVVLKNQIKVLKTVFNG
ncbi:Xylose isomerase [Alteracholeplasma palmae J233]|uniref:Xylose isomerase n=1 Tax=Alteracholeplasma palmae (strain ATCC 49389 / J233) TaxID=1318466 RepID=U4KR32_ALTPJ|nr:TIM barrel protein [Alteracholeplasma palmae]CCV63821.1 Xylose isomerase [Alteracholeplasma palmae J233]